jgi:hypothetical protein
VSVCWLSSQVAVGALEIPPSALVENIGKSRKLVRGARVFRGCSFIRRASPIDCHGAPWQSLVCPRPIVQLAPPRG